MPLFPCAYAHGYKDVGAMRLFAQTQGFTADSEERKNHQDYVESLYKWVAIFFGIICTLFGSIFTFLGIKTKKDVEKEMNDKLSRELNTTFNRLAAELKTNPDALKAAISEKSIEIELKNDYPITILHTAEKDELNNAKNMKNVLTAFGFKIVQNTLRNNASGNKFSENDIIVLFSNIKQEEQELLGEIKKSNCAILGFGTFNDVKEDALTLKHLKEYVANKECVTFCNSFATLYQNLISLLHYKREVNKTIG
ncbi:hypothetical protein FACS18947_6620 [Bacteroidia bacterium]|nr:hypothetical protein FACS18947_6620 [Bacteroidia bacterium]